MDKGHGHVSAEKLQLVLDFDGQRGLLRKTPGARRRNRLLYWKDPSPAAQTDAAEDDDASVRPLDMLPSLCMCSSCSLGEDEDR